MFRNKISVSDKRVAINFLPNRLLGSRRGSLSGGCFEQLVLFMKQNELRSMFKLDRHYHGCTIPPTATAAGTGCLRNCEKLATVTYFGDNDLSKALTNVEVEAGYSNQNCATVH